MKKLKNYVEILDTTLRDGEQTPGVAFTPAEKLHIARILLTRVKVDRIEIASARVSSGEFEGVKAIIDWAAHRGVVDAVEILGFVDGGKSVDWIAGAGCGVINLLCKGSERHCRIQLGKTPDEHYAAAVAEVKYAVERGLKVNIYLEDGINGLNADFGYVYNFIRAFDGLPVQRFMVPDTLGNAEPELITRCFSWLRNAFPDKKFDFHGHNDYNMSTANTLAAARAGVSGVHATVNGLGERAGNQPLETAVVVLRDMGGFKTGVAEKQLAYASSVVQALSGKRLAWNAPVVGQDVFTQTCGVHADGDKKGNLYANELLPERFGRTRNYALGKLAGKSSLDKNLEELGMELDPELRKKVLAEVVRLGDRKKSVAPTDLPFIVSNVLRTPMASLVKVDKYNITTKDGAAPKASVAIRFSDGTLVAGEASGDGGFDAFVKALKKALSGHGVKWPKLLDYEVRIPPGGKTDAIVEVSILWDDPHNDGATLRTIGVDSDQLVAAITATEKMLNFVLR
ncbi:MAG: alpha-isopropylmalate synthase regulatory domain-containing protein [Victivallaceae bacterium]|nr:alpha-isopropylmalate synthase regulatory domain-containing protein [Victivallaceae bacterium]